MVANNVLYNAKIALQNKVAKHAIRAILHQQKIEILQNYVNVQTVFINKMNMTQMNNANVNLKLIFKYKITN